MTDHEIVQAISVNLLRMAEWHYKDAQNSAEACQRYLEQSKQLGDQVKSPRAKPYLQRLQQLSLPEDFEQTDHTAERFLTLGVLLQHPEKWM